MTEYKSKYDYNISGGIDSEAIKTGIPALALIWRKNRGGVR